MCGRYTLHTERDALARRFDLDPEDLGTLEARYNIAPTQPVLTIRAVADALRPGYMRWGLLPGWVGPGRPAPNLINARLETAADKPAYREAFRRSRCWVLASGFYEWQRPRGASRYKTPHWIARSDGQPFAMAGLWTRGRDPDGASVPSCAILTTAANAVVRDIHERMPVILSPDTERRWLSSQLDDQPEKLRELLAPVPAELLCARPVSTAVNSVRRDGPELIELSDDPQLGFL